jgi:excisionase family DNA binding protein
MPDVAVAALDAIPRERVPAAIAYLATRLLAPVEEPADAYLTPDEVAALLRADRRWVYRNARRLGGVHLSRRRLRFPRRRVERYLAGRR